ncbi:anoctamin-10 isoform X2 [Coccinella septempunctata]|uniref:anoctamin-10 isoform X2 n=1 Tax=Coccinella septempunctata TaxID=41139 RepID=UPI001D093E29|nr:anoctamin-10 isoform X2 [Coccinella septempunctata]
MRMSNNLPERTTSVCSHLNYSDEDQDDNHDENNSYIKLLWNVHRNLEMVRGDMSRTNFSVEDERITSSLMDEEEEQLPPTYIVVTVAKETPDITLAWLIRKIRGHKRDGGAELVVMKQPRSAKEQYILHVSATRAKFLDTAEEMEMMKEDSVGQMREFTVKQLDDFLPQGMNVEDLFTVAERQTIVRHELENIRALPEDNHVPGFPTVSLYEGQSVFSVCRMQGIITNVYPLHDNEHLKKLGQKWFLSRKQPFEEIRLYFGEAIALYFTFLGYYTSSLVVPMAMGLLQMVIPTDGVLILCTFNVVWVTLMLEFWRRKSNELAFKWGTIGMTSLDEPRANFQGVMEKDPITGKCTPQYPRYKTYVKMYCVSLPIVVLCMIAAFFVMLSSFWIESWSKTFEEPYTCLVPVPSIVYSILVQVMNTYYRKLATFLTEWENHRTESQFYRHKVTKLVLFEFVNNFMSLFYIAFVIQDLNNLRSQLQTMLITSQLINNFTETMLPLFLQYWSKKVRKQQKKVFVDSWKNDNMPFKPSSSGDQGDPLNSVPILQADDPRVLAAEVEGCMDVYEETFDDFLELFIQFGYVFLFSSVYPVAALWAFLNNVIEIRADAFKLCQLCQRPMSRRVKDIGAWQRAFEVLGGLSIVTNCGILYLTPSIREKGSNFSQTEWLFLFIVLEHILLGVRYVLHISIGDKPEWVRVALAKQNYESRQALKHEREQRNKRLLYRKFKSVPTAL